MSKVVLDAATCAKLAGAKQTVEVSDEAGNLVGHFLPQDAFDRIMTHLLPQPTKEELAEARVEMLAHGGTSAEELRARLAEIQRQWEARQ